MDSIWDVEDINFHPFITNTLSSMLYFWSPDGNSHQHMMYRLKEVSHKFPMVNFGTMNVSLEVNQHIATIFKIRQVPTIIFFARGTRKHFVEKPLSIYQLIKLVETNIAEAERIERIYIASKRRRLNRV